MTQTQTFSEPRGAVRTVTDYQDGTQEERITDAGGQTTNLTIQTAQGEIAWTALPGGGESTTIVGNDGSSGFVNKTGNTQTLSLNVMNAHASPFGLGGPLFVIGGLLTLLSGIAIIVIGIWAIVLAVKYRQVLADVIVLAEARASEPIGP